MVDAGRIGRTSKHKDQGSDSPRESQATPSRRASSLKYPGEV